MANVPFAHLATPLRLETQRNSRINLRYLISHATRMKLGVCLGT